MAKSSRELARRKKTQAFARLCCEQRVFVLREPIVVGVEREEGGIWVHACEELGILSYAMTEDASRKEFAGDFAYLWDGLADEPDSALTVDAQQLKARLRSIVDHVETD